ncbi:D-sedoheptulose-7-phosphate isomerase [Curtobacterium sp. SP.BCo]|uniref:D-sedoheptulose-7-phosphate isomerase n=1 Tax=Curtobacterium sp. SP.BCo TaxID=3435229 RepID=UPI003F737EA0
MTTSTTAAGHRTTAIIDAYSAEVDRFARRFPVEDLTRIADVLVDAHRDGRTVFVFGNGACAALASHMAADLAKSLAPTRQADPLAPVPDRLRILALTDNAAMMTAVGNDFDHDDVFLEQLRVLLRAGDVVFGLSASGASPNVIRALEFARDRGAITVGFTGAMRGLPPILDLVETAAVVPSSDIDVIEDFHVAYHHALTRAFVAGVQDASS